MTFFEWVLANPLLVPFVLIGAVVLTKQFFDGTFR